jgi:RNA polymerase sigma-70 factor (ECF subfamily)
VGAQKWKDRAARTKNETLVDPLPEHTTLLSEPTSMDSVEQRHDILRLLAKLSERQRQVLAWHLDGYSGPEIAAELGISHDAVRSSLLKARRAVVTMRIKEGGQK